MSQPPADLRAVIDMLAAIAVSGPSPEAGRSISSSAETRVRMRTSTSLCFATSKTIQSKFPEWEFRLAMDGELVAWESDRVLELPLHEIHASTPAWHD